MLDKAVLDALRKPFPSEYIEWVVQRKTKEGNKAWCSANVDMRRYMQRLNDVVGGEWEVSYDLLKPDGSVIRCDLTIGGMLRSDVSEQEATGNNLVMQSIAQAFKRACVTFGLGMDLYFLPQGLAPINEYGQILTPPELPAWYYEKCGVKPEKKPAIVAKAEAVMNAAMPGAGDDFDNLHEDADVNDEAGNPPSFADLIKDDTYRKSWWTDVKKLGYTEETAKERLGVASTKDVTLTAPEVWDKLSSFCPKHNTETRRHEKDGKVWYSHKEGDKWCNAGVVK